ncbi:MAG: metallophosphoesterase [Bacteroidota bacterium]
MKKQWVIPDVHGHVKTLKCLVEELIRPARYDEIYLLGDYIDRGPDSRGVINYIRGLQEDEYNIVALKGNHEDFMVELYDAEVKARTGWLLNFANRKRKAWNAIGGKVTLESFHVSHLKDVPPDYIEWMRNLQYYVELDDFVLVHAGLNFKKEDPYEDKQAMLWIRDYQVIPEKIGNRRIIHGHVPVTMELITLAINNSFYKFIDIDNGPYVQGRTGFGNLVALELTEMELVIQDNRDV